MPAIQQRTAVCSCGANSITLTGDPLGVSICHCFACQKRSGAPFAQQARYAKYNVQTQGHTHCYSRTADSGNVAHFYFCPQCATTLYYQLEVAPEYIAVPVGLLSDPAFPAPNYSVYEDRMHHWIMLPVDMEHLA